MVMVAPETGFWSLPWMVTRSERRTPSCALEAQQKSADRASSTNPRKALRKCKVENCKCMTKQQTQGPRRYRRLSMSVQHKGQRFKQFNLKDGGRLPSTQRPRTLTGFAAGRRYDRRVRRCGRRGTGAAQLL